MVNLLCGPGIGFRIRPGKTQYDDVLYDVSPLGWYMKKFFAVYKGSEFNEFTFCHHRSPWTPIPATFEKSAATC